MDSQPFHSLINIDLYKVIYYEKCHNGIWDKNLAPSIYSFQDFDLIQQSPVLNIDINMVAFSRVL